MIPVDSVMADLESKGKENTRKIYGRRAVPMRHMFGVSVADLKVIAKTIKKQQALAYECTRRATWMRCIWQGW